MSTALAKKEAKQTMCDLEAKDVVRSKFLLNSTRKAITDDTSIARSLTDSDHTQNQLLRLSDKEHAVLTMQDSTFTSLQEWEGVVSEVKKDTFVASLLDVSKNSMVEDEEAEFPINDLTEDNKRQLKQGAVFRWNIGYQSIAGTKKRRSKIVFRRLPAWTQRDLDAAKKKARDISGSINWT